MEISNIVVFVVEGLITVGLFIGGYMLSQINKKFDQIAEANSQLSKDIHNLDKRVTRIETVNDERLKLIDEIHDNVGALAREMQSIREMYDKSMRELFEKYDLKRK